MQAVATTLSGHITTCHIKKSCCCCRCCKNYDSTTDTENVPIIFYLISVFSTFALRPPTYVKLYRSINVCNDVVAKHTERTLLTLCNSHTYKSKSKTDTKFSQMRADECIVRLWTSPLILRKRSQLLHERQRNRLTFRHRASSI